MLHAYAARFNMIDNLKKLQKLLGTKQGLSSTKNVKTFQDFLSH